VLSETPFIFHGSRVFDDSLENLDDFLCYITRRLINRGYKPQRDPRNFEAKNIVRSNIMCTKYISREIRQSNR